MNKVEAERLAKQGENFKEMYESMKNEFDLLQLKLKMQLKQLAESNIQISQINDQCLDQYLDTIKQAKIASQGMINNSEQLDTSFKGLWQLALHTEFLKSQLQAACHKNKIQIKPKVSVVV